MIRISPGPSLRALEPRLLLMGCSLNTIFRGPTSAHNPLFAATSAVIKDRGRGSRKWAQTPSVNPVCACGRRAKRKRKKGGGVAHTWMLACTCVFCLFLCVFFFFFAQEGEANSCWPPLHRAPPTHQTPRIHRRPRLREKEKNKKTTKQKPAGVVAARTKAPLLRRHLQESSGRRERKRGLTLRVQKHSSQEALKLYVKEKKKHFLAASGGKLLLALEE